MLGSVDAEFSSALLLEEVLPADAAATAAIIAIAKGERSGTMLDAPLLS
jgi:hypothetical protein